MFGDVIGGMTLSNVAEAKLSTRLIFAPLAKDEESPTSTMIFLFILRSPAIPASSPLRFK